MPVRVKAFLVHLSVSAVALLLVFLLVFCFWYVPPLHKAVNVSGVFLLLLLVDLALGPLLTLLVYNSSKKTLVLDLSFICLLQVAALAYGIWTLSQGRPAWLVFNADRFDLVRVVDIDPRKIDEADRIYRHPSLLGPQWVAAAPPDDLDERNKLLLEAVRGGNDIYVMPNLYLPLHDKRDQILLRSRSLEQLKDANSSDDINSVLKHWPGADSWLPLMTIDKPMVVLFDRQAAAVVAIVDLRPWP